MLEKDVEPARCEGQRGFDPLVVLYNLRDLNPKQTNEFVLGFTASEPCEGSME